MSNGVEVLNFYVNSIKVPEEDPPCVAQKPPERQRWRCLLQLPQMRSFDAP